MWQDKAACQGADPNLFDPRDFYTPADRELLQRGANEFCTHCPVMAQCGAEADLHRHIGTWSGVHRRVKQGEYVWDVLADGAVEPQLPEQRRAAGAAAATWVAAS